jgi:hypothetical protein
VPTAPTNGGTCPGPFTFVVQDGTPPYNVVVAQPAGQPPVTPVPSVVTTSPGTVTVSGLNSPPATGAFFTYEITVGDSSVPQTFDQATIRCTTP